MCGIVGVIQFKSEIERDRRLAAIKILFSNTMLLTENRGEDATGLYQVHQDGDWMLAKIGEKASKWIYSKKGNGDKDLAYSDFLDTWSQHPEDCTALVGHCRKATVGSKGADNKDNHPFAIQLDERNAILGVHNGTLNNHEIIFKNLGGSPVRQGTVDSESIFHLLYHATNAGTEPITAETMKHIGVRLDGAAAVVTVNSRFPNIVACFREGRPLDMIGIWPLNIIVLCSEKKFVDEAVARYNFIQRFMDTSLPEITTKDRAITEREYRIFNTEKDFPDLTSGVDYYLFDKVSEHGDIRAFSTPILPEWKAPTKSTSYDYEGAAYSAYGGRSFGPYAGYNGASSSALSTSKTEAKTETTAVKTSKAPAEGTEDGIIKVEARLLSEDPTKATVDAGFARAKSLGAIVHYDYPKELANAVGISVDSLNNMPDIDLANLVAATNFNIGYAMALCDAKEEVDTILKKGREQLQKMEKLAEKQAKAERKIWELKAILQAIVALAGSSIAIKERSVRIALVSMKGMEKDRIDGAMQTYKEMLEDSKSISAVQALKSLLEKMSRSAREKRRAREEKSN